MTQGIVTIKSGKKVIMKIIAGCDGYNARKIANKLKEKWPMNIDDVYKMALSLGFGDTDCLVIVTDKEIKYEREPGTEIHPRFRETFQQPKFNPRCESGTADFIVIVNV
ncbi:MAG: hypothetical protein UT05_C0001G0036 [Parcubacteria group bacterium GW2011_GWF2_38_76]|nr:MAG: hypothetical protein UT05_C0001G0036 [Parcubacteria group bacterium GW2011_GWF2_38_76]HBM45987.1 hypothetical protein [Patescibacteria group bacterium]